MEHLRVREERVAGSGEDWRSEEAVKEGCWEVCLRVVEEALEFVR